MSKLLPHPRRRRRPLEAIRRTFDIAVAAVLLAFSVPLVAVLAVAIYFDDRGPVFFGHERVGRNGRPFVCWKLRSMHRSTTRDLALDAALWANYVAADFKIRDGRDPRITRVGRFLRSTYLDELPQLWNVLRGEMSLVGPRPVVRQELAWYGPLVEEFLSVRPGISGAWQLTDHVPYPERVYVELSYVRLRSLRLDAFLVLSTVYALLTRRDAPVDFLLPERFRRRRPTVVEAASGAAASDI